MTIHGRVAGEIVRFIDLLRVWGRSVVKHFHDMASYRIHPESVFSAGI